MNRPVLAWLILFSLNVRQSLAWHPSLFPAAITFVAILATIPEKRVGTRSKFSPPPTFNVDNQVIFARDCLKEICEEFSSEGNASDRHGVTIF